jgi:hypothetical protein
VTFSRIRIVVALDPLDIVFARPQMNRQLVLANLNPGDEPPSFAMLNQPAADLKSPTESRSPRFGIRWGYPVPVESMRVAGEGFLAKERPRYPTKGPSGPIKHRAGVPGKTIPAVRGFTDGLLG